MPPTTKAAELLEQGLEAEEDRILVEMAEKRLDDLHALYRQLVEEYPDKETIPPEDVQNALFKKLSLIVEV